MLPSFLYVFLDTDTKSVPCPHHSQPPHHRNHRAVGVEYVHNTDVHPHSDPSVIHTARTSPNGRIVVSAGALGSPGILERSGVGSKDVLAKACVPVVVDLPGVGENYQGGWASNISFAFSFPRLFFFEVE